MIDSKRVLAAFVGVFIASVASAQTLVGGIIDEDTTWDLARSPFLANIDVIVEQGATLTIEPGVEVLFRAGFGLQVGVDGLNPLRTATLIADGTAAQPIVFGLAVPGTGTWTGIEFGRDAVDAIATTDGRYVRGSVIRHASIMDSTRAVAISGSTVFLEHVVIRDCSDGISIENPDPPRTAWIRDVDLQATRDGIRVRSAGDVRVLDSSIMGASRGMDAQLGSGDDNLLSLESVDIIDCGLGLNALGADRMVILDCRFEGNSAPGMIAAGTASLSGEIRNTTFISNNPTRSTPQGGGASITRADDWLIEDSHFEGNQTSGFDDGDGGGLYFQGRSITMRRCTFTENTSEGSGGGATLILSSEPASSAIEDCEFVENRAEQGSGAGLLVTTGSFSSATLLLRGNRFEGNEGRLNGGLAVWNERARIIENDFIQNTAQTSGGALRLLNDVDGVLILGNRFIGNTTAAGGGAIDLSDTLLTGDMRIRENLFESNSADVGGAIGNIPGGDLRLAGNTFENNDARLGGAIHLRDRGMLDMSPESNLLNRLSGNTADLGSAIYNGSAEDSDATGVCWGTEDLAEIADMIYDQSDDPARGVVVFDPIATDCAPPCRVDLDGDGRLTLFDFLAFQNLFDAGDPGADFDADGRLTLFDFLAFQNEFDAGCG
ncbi:MAG: right-handed parallel beta-helix repeat-containing protein [Phycisphaerales bacterium]|nr:right-handed parallel beta-helix repeat-containing protein [Phycisphaerales bacterium]